MKLERQCAALRTATVTLKDAYIKSAVRRKDGGVFDFVVLMTDTGAFTVPLHAFDADDWEIGDRMEILYRESNGYRNAQTINHVKEKKDDEA